MTDSDSGLQGRAGIEYILQEYYECLSDDLSSDPYYSGPEKHFAIIACHHKDFLNFMKERKNELAKQDTKRLLLDEPKEIDDRLLYCISCPQCRYE